MGWYDELLGKIFDNGTELEGLGGLNFIGFNITPDTSDPDNMRYNIAVAGAATTSDDVTNESSVPGDTVTEALDSLSSDLADVSSDGAEGALQYSDGAGGFVGTEFLFWDETDGVLYWDHPTLGLLRVFGVGPGGNDDLSIGDVVDPVGHSIYYDAGDAKFHVQRCGGTTLATLSKSGGVGLYDWNGTIHTDIGRLDFSGTISTQGTVRAASGFQIWNRNGANDMPMLRDIGSGILVVGGGGATEWAHLQLEALTDVIIKTATVARVTVTTTAVTLAVPLALGTNAISGVTSLTMTGAISGATSIGCTSLACAGAITSVTTLNGARVSAPTQGANLTNADTTTHITSTGANHYMPPGTTSTARNITAGVTGASKGAVQTYHIAAQGHNVLIKDDAGTTLYTVTAGDARIVDVRYNDGTTHYELAGWKPAQ